MKFLSLSGARLRAWSSQHLAVTLLVPGLAKQQHSDQYVVTT